ncbi:MAG: aminotransferase class I/II-fold pyridoxal phosphate-dependent enzyme [Erysipelotrichaceae bacterium]|nr:aminotransferase class I/II-fold pyridoxal phosphate-dependent enzyme [Erysipelotrichaceae bacterium]
MYSFENDYSEGACQKVLDYLVAHNRVQTPGYGIDEYSEKAQDLIRDLIGNKDADVHFITGGTPCNALAINLIKPYQAVICAANGHINVHETGAVEATGHKILATEGKDGKILPEEIEKVVLSHNDEHMVSPKMVFISNASEYGTIYSKKELTDISGMCRKYGLYLYLDGARLGNALTAKGNDLTIEDIAKLTDIFYIGGTKNGALLGEAMVIINDDLKPDFRYCIKRQCSMLAKTRIISQQFIALLEDDTYLNNARNANEKAQALKKILADHGIEMFMDSPTNQIFPILEDGLVEKLKQKYRFIEWGRYDDSHTTVRLVCSWMTEDEVIREFAEDIDAYMN